MQQENLCARIHKQIFQLMCDPYLKRFLLFLPLSQTFPYEVKLNVRHLIGSLNQTICEEIVIKFQKNYPSSPPMIKVIVDQQAKAEIPQIVIRCSQIQPQNWKSQTSLIKIIKNLVQFIDLYWQSYYNFGQNPQFQFLKNGKNTNQANKHKNMMLNSSNIKSTSYQKVLTTKLQDVLKQVKDLSNQRNLNLCLQAINKYKNNGLNFEEVYMFLMKNTDFRGQLMREILNGKWLNRILKSSISIKYKKQLISLQNTLLRQIQYIQKQTQSRMNDQAVNN